MKSIKIFVVLLVLSFMFVQSVMAKVEILPDLTPEQSESLQLDVNILGLCLIKWATAYIPYGFTTEFSLDSSLKPCEPAVTLLANHLVELGATKDEVNDTLKKVYNDVKILLDNARNEYAMERLRQEKESTPPTRSEPQKQLI
jgi:hypothetical protein